MDRDDLLAALANGGGVGRMGAVPGFNDLPGLFVAELELLLQGVDVTGLTEQMLDVGASQASTTLTTTPQLEWLGLSVATPREVRLVQDLQGGPGPDDAAAPSRPSLFEAVFEDDHAEEWISALRDCRAAVLAVGPKPPDQFESIFAWQATWHAAVIPLALHVFPSGVDVIGYGT